ncbi:MAG: hypothetical protein MZV49_25805 [Rhodopseudomonas palustris]|nr:hypothetical protein [Rhodopseudomonas palustris]
MNRRAVIIEAASPITVDQPRAHHRQAGARRRGRPDADPRRDEVRRGRRRRRQVRRRRDWWTRGPTPSGTITETFKKYPDIGVLLPAMGYGDKQVKDLETTINKTPCDTVIIGTPIDLNRLIKIKKPTVRVSYELQEIGKPDLMDVLKPFLKKKAEVQKPEVRSQDRRRRERSG